MLVILQPVSQGYSLQSQQSQSACLSKSKYSISETPRGIPEHCPLTFCFLFKSVVETHSHLLLQVYSTFFNSQYDLHLAWVRLQPMPAAPLVPFSAVLGRGKEHWQVREKEAASRLAWENLDSRASPAPALQTETWSQRESEQGRSMRPTLLIKHQLIQLFCYFDVIWCNHDTKLYWAINHVTAMPVPALWKVDFYLQV